MIGKVAISLLITLACSAVEPGTLTKTYENNLLTRMYAECMQESGPRRVPSAERRRYCGKLVILQKATWEWERCVNEYGSAACGDRPRYEDIP